MEKDLERYYNDFKRPPFAPIYHPTEEEFADPISYVAKIKPEAQQFGLIKIIPPPSFRPPFCIDPAKFEFVPRVQRLNEIDALFRLRIIYINKLVHFWKYSKDQQFRIPYIDNKYIDLYRLRQMVEEEGGLKRVNDTRRWAHIAKSLGFRGNAGQTMRQCYTRWIHPFELSVSNKDPQQNPSSSNISGGSPKKGAASGRGGGGGCVAAPRRRCCRPTTKQKQQQQLQHSPSQHHNHHHHQTDGGADHDVGEHAGADVAVPLQQHANDSNSDGTTLSVCCSVPSSSGGPADDAEGGGGGDDGTASATDQCDAGGGGGEELTTDATMPPPLVQKDGLEEEDEGEEEEETAEEEEEEEEEEMSLPPLTRSQARMMAGSAKTAVPSLDKSSIQAGHRTTPIELVMCGRCGDGDDEARLLLCETCDASMHTYCATPPLTTVPKGEWRCAQCVANAVRSVSMDFGFTDSNQCFTLDTFGEWANLFKQQYFNLEPREVPSERVEREFWRNVIDIDKGVQVKYGADLISSKVGSGFPRREDVMRGVGGDARERQLYANHPWNLNNLPKVRESVLCHMTTDISGMIVPWVYIGMLFSTFCWHVEDHWLYSINYNHWGERKIWYGVPGDEAELFDRVVKESAPELFVENKDLLHQMITHLNPQILVDRGVHVYTVHQNAGEFVITFPRSYHAGFNEGVNCAEAVNFAPPDWLNKGRLCLDNYAKVGRTCVFSHEELVMKMVHVAHKMSIAMCLATLDELSWIVARETDFRRRLSDAGVHANVFCRFEDIPDDERSCIVCHTTLFCSSLCCQHDGRMVCAQHVQQLCNECSMEQCCLKFRYTLDDLEPLVHRLTERTTAFFEWRNTVAELYDEKRLTMTTTTTVVKAEIDNTSTVDDNKLMIKMETEEITGGGERQRKIDVFHLRSLADQWRNARFPHCDEIQRINRAIAQFERTATVVRKVLNRKIRLRDQTRCQKADTRWEYAEVRNLRQQLADSLLEDKELEDAIQDLCQRVERWKLHASAALERPFAGVQTVDELSALVTEAQEDFNVKLEAEGLDRLKSELTRCQWLVSANEIVQQIERHEGRKEAESMAVEKRVSVDEQQLLQKEEEHVEEGEKGANDMTLRMNSTKDEAATTTEEEEGEELEPKRVELHALAKIVADGLKWCHCCAAVQQVYTELEHFLNYATSIDQRAADFLALARKKQQQKQDHGGGVADTASSSPATAAVVGFEQARQKWASIAASSAKDGTSKVGLSNCIDLLQSPAIDCFRAELELAQKLYDAFEQLNKKAFSLRSVEQVEHNFAQSLFERNGQRHAKLKMWLDGLQRFVERVRTIFQKNVSYYTLFDIVAGRSDLPALIEGELMPLALFTTTKYSDNWRPLRPFVSRDQLVAHLQSIGDQQCTLLHALRLANAERTPKETCCCARDVPPSTSPGRRQRLNCLTPSSSPSSSCKTNGGSRQRKRSSLPGRTSGGGGGAIDTSSPTMVVDGRRTTTTPTTTLSSSTTIEQHQMDVSEHTSAAVVEQRIAANEMIPCFVCNANLHVVCVQWDPFFARLPPGVLLCQRCLRSRRPCIEDIEAACRSSELPENCLERIVVQNLFNRSVNIFTRLQRLLHNIPKGTIQIEPNVEAALKKWLTMALSLEVTDIEVYNMLLNSAYFDLFPLPQRQIQIWHHVRERMVDAQPLPIIFGHSIGGCLFSSSTTLGANGGIGGGGGRRSTNAGGKRRSGGNNNNNNGTNIQQQLRHSLNAVLNISSCSSAASCSSSADSSLSLAVCPVFSGSSPAKQQRRHHHQHQQQQYEQPPGSFASVKKAEGKKIDNYGHDDDLAMVVDEQKYAANDDDDDGGGGQEGTVVKREDEQKQIDQESSNNGQQHGGSGHMEKCAADFCLRPYSEFTRWIQCEAGCARWYHFCCVGISVRGVQHISAYCCYKCAAAATAASSTINAATAPSTLTSVATDAALAVAGDEAIVCAATDNKMEQHSPPSPQHRSPTATATV